MASPNDILVSINGLVTLGAAIIAVVVSGRLVSRNVSLLENASKHRILSQVFLLVVCFSIGGLFVQPLIDITGVMYTFIDAFIPPFSTAVSQIATTWGEVSWQLFAGIRILLTLLVYTFTLWFIRKTSGLWHSLIPRSVHLTSVEEGLVGLAIAGLIHREVEVVVFNVVTAGAPALSIQLHMGSAGFLIGWMLGLLLVSVIAFTLGHWFVSSMDARR